MATLSAMNPETSMPIHVGVQLGSAVLQALAEDAGVDVLHLKGPSAWAFEPQAGGEPGAASPARRASEDVDLLVRPSQVATLFGALEQHGWDLAYRFEDGSAFEHASTWIRPGLVAADIHRRFPGISVDPELAFDRLWQHRCTFPIAGYPCTVPGPAGQRLILILNATRDGDLAGPDIARAWWAATEGERAEVESLAGELGATVPLAAGTGRLEDHRADRQYALWRALSTGDRTRSTLWFARVRAEPTVLARVRRGLALVGPKPDRLRHTLGREPRRVELAAAWLGQWRLVGRELWHAVGRRVRAVTRGGER